MIVCFFAVSRLGVARTIHLAFRILQGTALTCISDTPETDGVVFGPKAGTRPLLLIEFSLPNNGMSLGRQKCGVLLRGKGDEMNVRANRPRCSPCP